MNETRFDDLASRLLDDVLTADELSELIQLARDNPERQAELQSQLEVSEMITQAEDELRDSPLFIAATLDRIDDHPFVATVRSALVEGGNKPRRTPVRVSRWPWAVAAAAVVALIASVALLRPKDEPEIIRITALNGSTQWTGDGGRVKVDLEVGRSLGGGTLESLAADSWAVLEFRDGSKVTVSGRSMLTIAGGAQKELHLRQGSLSASVSPQHAGERMIINTPTAKLEILGTQLNVDADPSSTVLNVNEGRVRVTRLVDGRVAEVPAGHQIVASLDRLVDYKARRRAEPVHSWQVTLPKDAKHGQWQRDRGEHSDSVRAAPYLVTCGRPKPLLIYMSAFAVASSDSPPVFLSPGGRFRIRGRMESTGKLIFGLTMHYPKGGFAGKYVASRRIEVSEERGGNFDIELRLADFKPDEARFPGVRIDFELVDCWCLTLHEDLGLRIGDVELTQANSPAR